MKAQALTRIYVFAMSAVFATVATVGVATMMTLSGEHARTQFDAELGRSKDPGEAQATA